MGRAREGRHAALALRGEWLGGRASGLGGVSLRHAHKVVVWAVWAAGCG